MREDNETRSVEENIERLGEDMSSLLNEVRLSLRDNLEQVEWRWHHLENQLEQLRKGLKKPGRDVSKAARKFGDEMKKSTSAVVRTLRDTAKH